MTDRPFYDSLAPHYDLIYPDWHGSMARQGEALDRLIRAHLPSISTPLRVLDVAAGIGTQALALAALGYRVTARDLSRVAVTRLGREADARGLAVDRGVCDMREVAAAVDGPFDVVICCDNALPHLLTDRDITQALAQFRAVLVDGGLCVCSVRDYDRIDRASSAHHDYGERRRGSAIFRLWQEWSWLDAMHYDVTFVIAEETARGPAELVRTTTRYYAVGIPTLLELMTSVGFSDAHRVDGEYFQPLVVARRAVEEA